MSSPLVRARSTIVFVAALLVATYAAVRIERESAAAAPARAHGEPAPAIEPSADLPPPPAPRALSAQERKWAQIAWRYFARNTDETTGLVGSVQGYPAATMWDTGSYLLALVSARRLDLVAQDEFDARMEKALRSLARMPLYQGVLPNKSYSTATLAMVDYAGNPAPNGIGWSAIDLGRLLVALDAVALQFPAHSKAVGDVLRRFDLARAVGNGSLVGVSVAADGRVQQVQEGRLGYEQYAASGFALVGLAARDALSYRPQLSWVQVQGLRIPLDRRDPKKYGARDFVVSEPYMLEGLELGWDASSRELAWRVHSAQAARFRETGVLTAVTEDHLDRAPYFVYNAVFSDGKAWNTITENGESVPAMRTLSVKAAFGWHALYRSDYTSRLVGALDGLYEPDKGWYAGRYEADGAPNRVLSTNTNAVVLESLAFIAHGRLLDMRGVAK